MVMVMVMLWLCLLFHRLEAFLWQRRVEVAFVFEVRDRFWLRVGVALNFVHCDARPAYARFEFFAFVAEAISRAMMIEVKRLRFRRERSCTWIW